MLLCLSLPRLCSDLLRDIVDASRLAALLPSRILLVKYEELVTSPEEALRTILKVGLAKPCLFIVAVYIKISILLDHFLRT